MKDEVALSILKSMCSEMRVSKRIAELEVLYRSTRALNKQVPKKPIMKYFEEYESEHLCCPNCEDILTDRIPAEPKTFYFYCFNCGQKLDWE